MQQEDISSINDSFERYKDRITNFSNEFEFGLFIYILKRSLPVLFLIFILAGLSAYLYLRYTAPLYSASVTLQLEKSDKANKILNVDQYFDDNALSSDIELLRSRFLLLRTIESMQIDVRYFEQGRVRSSDHYNKSGYQVSNVQISDSLIAIQKAYFIRFDDNYDFFISDKGRELGPFSNGDEVVLNEVSFEVNLLNPESMIKGMDYSKYFTFETPEKLCNEFYSRVSALVLNPTAQTIQILCEDANPKLASDLVMAHAYTFLEYDKERKKESAEKVLEFIEEQLDTVAYNLRNAEFLLNSFKQEHRLTNLSEVTIMYMDRLTDYENDIVQLELEHSLLQEVKSISKYDPKDVDVYKLISLLAGTQYEATLNSLLVQLNDLLKNKEEKYYDVTDDSENMKAINYRIDIQKKLILESVVSLESKVLTKKRILEEKAQDIEQTFRNIPAQELEFARYQRLFDINEKFYTILLEKKIEYRISKAGFVTDNKILEASRVPLLPISPVSNLIYFGFLGFGFLVGLVFVIGRYLLHNNITSLNEIAKLSNASIGVLGLIPKYREEIPVSQLIIDKKPKSLIAESFRTIRTNLQFVDNTPGPKVLAITSTISSEGKTFVSINLSGIIAVTGKKVILIDLDMRRPKIHKGFGVDNDIGMSTLLIGKNTLEECVRTSSIENLHFITAGPIPPNPSELVITKEMDRLVDHLKTIYDVIVIDNPPVGLVTDGIQAIKKADYPIYIFRADYSKKHFVQNVDRLINENGITKLSVILNSVDVERNKYGYYYGYGYGYGYSYVGGYDNAYTSSDTRTRSIWKKIKGLWK